MKCPRCPSGLLKQEKYEEVQIDRCSTCLGVWLDEGELLHIIQKKEVQFTSNQIVETLNKTATVIPEFEYKTKEFCPKCSIQMTPMNFQYGSGVVIDRCPSKHGVWLDQNELEKAQIFFETNEIKKDSESKKWNELSNNAKNKSFSETKGIDGGILFKLIYKIINQS